MENFNLVKYYNQMRLTGLDDAQIAASLGITVEALLAALGEQGYYATVHLPKKFTILTYKNGTAQIDPWFYTYVTDNHEAIVPWFQAMSSANNDPVARVTLQAELDKLFYTTFTFEDNHILKDSQVNPCAGGCNFGVHLDYPAGFVIRLSIVAGVNQNDVEWTPLFSFSISLVTDSETGDTTLVLDDDIEVRQEAIDAAHIQSITVSMMSLYYE